MKPVRHSQQRAAIQAELAARRDHPTAEALYHELKQTWPALSLGTVYRNLAQLCEAGAAQKLSGMGADRFDGNPDPHLHLTCECCGSVTDLDMPVRDVLREPQRRAEECFLGKVTGCALQFTGICQTCLQAEQAQK